MEFQITEIPSTAKEGAYEPATTRIFTERTEAEEALPKIWAANRMKEAMVAYEAGQSWDEYTENGKQANRIQFDQVYPDQSVRSITRNYRDENAPIDPETIVAQLESGIDPDVVVLNLTGWHCVSDEEQTNVIIDAVMSASDVYSTDAPSPRGQLDYYHRDNIYADSEKTYRCVLASEDTHPVSMPMFDTLEGAKSHIKDAWISRFMTFAIHAQEDEVDWDTETNKGAKCLPFQIVEVYKSGKERTLFEDYRPDFDTEADTALIAKLQQIGCSADRIVTMLESAYCLPEGTVSVADVQKTIRDTTSAALTR